MKARRLNETGMELVLDWLIRARSGEATAVPAEFLSDGEFSTEVDPSIEVKAIQFKSRYQIAVYLDSIIPKSQVAHLQSDAGFWSWLSLYYFDQLCPPRPDGTRKVGQLERYIPSFSNFRTYYRHLLVGPWRVYRAHGDNPKLTKVVLSGRPDTPGEIAEQLLAQQRLISNPTVLEVAGELYLDADGQPKRGSGSSGRGSPRRLTQVLKQFDLTFDLFAMSGVELASLLPREFDRFRAAD
jgi:hypothetical protein